MISNSLRNDFNYKTGYLDDSAAFYVGVVCTVIAVPIIMQLDVKVEKNKHSFFTTMKHVIKMADFNGFVLVEIIMGMMYSFHLVYRPVFATELHASKTLIGSMIEIDIYSSCLFVLSS